MYNRDTMTEQTDSVVPQHLGLILDGNRRWAKERSLPSAEGYRRGFDALRTITSSAMRSGVRYVSAYVFSTENWKRDKDEIQQLMKLLTWALKYEVKKLEKEGVRLRVIGSRLKLGHAIASAIHDAEELTKNNTRGTL